MTGVPGSVVVAVGAPASDAAAGHGVHYAILVIGLVGLCAVGLAQARGSHEEAERRVPIEGGRASTGTTATRAPDRAWASLWRGRAQLPATERIVVPVAVVSAAAAAGVHAAMGPPHFRESLLFGTFFAVTALLQLVWAWMLAVHRTRALLVLGAVGNLAVLGLWALTRTVGLPFGLLAHPEAVGTWDLACGVWEVAVAACCVVLLRSRRTSGQVAPWRDWPSSVRLYVAGSVLMLGALTLVGSAA